MASHFTIDATTKSGISLRWRQRWNGTHTAERSGYSEDAGSRSTTTWDGAYFRPIPWPSSRTTYRDRTTRWSSRTNGPGTASARPMIWASTLWRRDRSEDRRWSSCVFGARPRRQAPADPSWLEAGRRPSGRGQRGSRGGAGSVTVKREPTPIVLETSTWPRWAPTI